MDSNLLSPRVNDLTERTAKKLFKLCTNDRQQDRETAVLALFSKTDSESVDYQWRLCTEHNALLKEIEPTVKNQLITRIRNTIPKTTFNAERELPRIFILKHIEGKSIEIPTDLAFAILNDPLSFPSFLLHTLVLQRDNDSINFLFKSLRDKLDNDKFLVFLTTLLAKLKPEQIPGALNEIKPLLNHRDFIVRIRALVAITTLAPRLEDPAQILSLIDEDTKPLLNDRSDLVRTRALEAITALAPRLEDPAQILSLINEDIKPLLNDRKDSVRTLALRAITALASRLKNSAQILSLINKIKPLLNDRNDSVRTEALEAITALAPRLEDPAQILSLFNEDTKPLLDFIIRIRALEAIIRLEPRLEDPAQILSLFNEIKPLLNHRNDWVRTRALRAITAFASRLKNSAQILSLIDEDIKPLLKNSSLDYTALEAITTLAPRLEDPDQILSLINEIKPLLNDRMDSVHTEPLEAITALASRLKNSAQILSLINEIKPLLSHRGSRVRIRALEAITTLASRLENSDQILSLINEIKPLLNDCNLGLDYTALRAVTTLAPRLEDPAQILSLINEDIKPLLNLRDDLIREPAKKAVGTLFSSLSSTQQLELMKQFIDILKINNSLWCRLYPSNPSSHTIFQLIAYIVSLQDNVHFLSRELLQELLQVIQKELNSKDTEVRDAAWSALISLAFRCPEQVKNCFEQDKIDNKDWTTNALKFLINLCENQPAQHNETAFFERTSHKNKPVVQKIEKIKMTDDEAKELNFWATNLDFVKKHPSRIPAAQTAGPISANH